MIYVTHLWKRHRREISCDLLVAEEEVKRFSYDMMALFKAQFCKGNMFCNNISTSKAKRWKKV